MITVSGDGRGDFPTIQAAVDAAPEYNGEPVVILVKPGIYTERVYVDRDGILLKGEDPEKTVITWSACAKDKDAEGKEKGTFLSYSVLVCGNDVTLESLTIRNDAGDGHEVGQAVALYAGGNRFTCRNVRLIAHQDTLFCGPVITKTARDALPRVIPAVTDSAGDCPPVRLRQYFENCYIQGDTDYIFGPAQVWFEGCELFMNEAGGWYTAANTPEAEKYGFVLHRCRLTGACPEGKGKLGRPWRRFCRTLYLECDMDEHVAPWGFYDWDTERVITERCGEYGTTGARADLGTRNPAAKKLTAAEASAVTPEAALAGWTGWRK